MANVYFGSSFGATDTNWNTVANWFSYPGFSTSNSTIPPVPLLRLPNASTDTVLIWGGNVLTGPSTTYSGAIIINGGPTLANFVGYGYIAAGHYSGAITVSPANSYAQIQGGIWDGPISIQATDVGSGGGWIGGNAVINGNITASGSLSDISSSPNRTIRCAFINGTPTIYGNISCQGLRVAGSPIIYGVITRTQNNPVGGWTNGYQNVNVNYPAQFSVPDYYAGGTYSPAITVTLTWSGNLPVLSYSSPPLDPGFAAGGGTFAPRYTFVGFPDILGTGLL